MIEEQRRLVRYCMRRGYTMFRCIGCGRIGHASARIAVHQLKGRPRCRECGMPGTTWRPTFG